MEINKARWRYLKAAEVDLRKKCFSNGQLYVTFSRAKLSWQSGDTDGTWWKNQKYCVQRGVIERKHERLTKYKNYFATDQYYS